MPIPPVHHYIIPCMTLTNLLLPLQSKHLIHVTQYLHSLTASTPVTLIAGHKLCNDEHITITAALQTTRCMPAKLITKLHHIQ